MTDIPPTSHPSTQPNPGNEKESSAAPKKSGFTGVAAVQHAIAILQALDVNSPELGVNELARRAGMHKSTASRILATLETVRFVTRNPETGRFRIGMGLIALVNPLVGSLDVVKLARPYIDKLARETGETTSLGFWMDGEIIMVEQVPGSRAVGFLARASARTPAHCTASGKLFLAYQTPEERQAFFSRPLEKYTPQTKTTQEELQPDLIKAQEQGFATNYEEFQPESCGIAAMIWGPKGVPLAALTMAVPKHRFGKEAEENLARVTVEAANELSRSLGHIPGRF